jgi:uncharacterized protein YndB with AHSA1/START domain
VLVARNSISVAASPERVFEVLSDPFAYGDWVVGTRAILGVDGPWPEAGASLRYELGLGPLRMRDRTFAIAVQAPHRLELLAKAGPFPDVTITFEVRAAEAGAHVTLQEHAANPWLRAAAGPLGDLAILLRNRVALHRLKRLSETGG